MRSNYVHAVLLVAAIVTLTACTSVSSPGSSGSATPLNPTTSPSSVTSTSTPPKTEPTSADPSGPFTRIDCMAGEDPALVASSVVVENGRILPGLYPNALERPGGNSTIIRRTALPSDVDLVSATLCVATYDRESQFVGYWLRAFTGDIATLTEALHTAPQPRTDQACAEYYEAYPNIWVESDEGKYYAPLWPPDACHHYTDPAPGDYLNESTLAAFDPKDVVRELVDR